MAEFEVLTFGETMIRLTPPNFQRLEQATSLTIEVGGSESNTAVGLARLGLKTGWLSGLPNNPLGRLVAGTLQRYGVDTGPVVWKDEGRLGLFFVEEGKKPRGSQVIYDRRHSVFSSLTPADVPESLFTQSQAGHLHLSGISVALTDQSRQTSRHLVSLAREAGWTVSFDLNYRSKLWPPEQAQSLCGQFINDSTIFILPRRDATTVYDLPPDATPKETISALAGRFPDPIIVMTMGKDGAMGRTPDGRLFQHGIFEADEVGRIGGGDAFGAGLLYGFLTTAGPVGDKLQTGLKWGAAMGALKYSIVGDMPVVEKSMVEALLNAEGGGSAALKR